MENFKFRFKSLPFVQTQLYRIRYLLSIYARFARLKVMKARDILEQEAKNNSWSHAYLFVGQNDQIVNELIEFIAESRGCLATDISRVSPAVDVSGKGGEIKVDEIRELLHNISLSPNGECRLAVIDNCERLNQSSGNILLKHLEEPPAQVIFILSAKKESVLPTIKSRCRIINIEGKAEDLSDPTQEYLPEIKKGFFAASKVIEAAVKGEQTGQVLEEIRQYLREKLVQTKDGSVAADIEYLEKIAKEIKNNANPRLSLENLVIRIEKHF